MGQCPARERLKMLPSWKLCHRLCYNHRNVFLCLVYRISRFPALTPIFIPILCQLHSEARYRESRYCPQLYNRTKRFRPEEYTLPSDRVGPKSGMP